MSRVLRIAIVGAESTGKTALAADLASQLARDTGLRVAWIPEWLRHWCEEHGRTPRADEQADIMRMQHELIDAAAALNEIVVCDTTALMTAVYSRHVFGDRSLDGAALSLHGRIDLTLLMALDLPWVPDGLQRDGPHVRRPVDAALRELLAMGKVPFAEVQGQGTDRLSCALAAVKPLLPPMLPLPLPNRY